MILSTQTAFSVQNVCKAIQENFGESEVKEYCNKSDIDYTYCSFCGIKTPTIQTTHTKTCAFCNKSKTNEIKNTLF